MSIEVRMPQESMAMLEGTVVQWFKSAGDSVLKGEPIAEIESDKATFEVAAPESGLLVSIAVGEGEVVPVRTVLATISGGDDVHDQTSSQEGPSERSGKGTQPVGASQPAGGSQPAAPTGSPQIVPAGAPPGPGARYRSGQGSGNGSRRPHYRSRRSGHDRRPRRRGRIRRCDFPGHCFARGTRESRRANVGKPAIHGAAHPDHRGRRD